MPDNQFDDFVGRNLSDLSASVPEGAWDRLADKQFDLHCKQNLQHMQVPVAEEIWTRISDTRFDQHISDQLSNYIAPVPAGSFEQLDDTRLDQFFGASLVNREVPVGEEQWDKIAGALLDQHSGKVFDNFEVPVAEGLWSKIADRQFDQHFGSNLADVTAPVSTGMWDKIADTQFDQHFGSNLADVTAPVSTGMWDKISDTQFDQHFQTQLGNFEAPVAEDMWDRVKPKEEDDRKFFYWMRFPMAAAIMGLLFLGGIYASYVLYQNYIRNQQTKTGTQVLRDSSHEKNVPSPEMEPANAPAVIPGTDLENATIPPVTDNSSSNNGLPPQDNVASENQGGTHLPKAGGLFIKKQKNNQSILSGFQVPNAAKKPTGSAMNGTQDNVQAEDILPVYANSNLQDNTEGFRKLAHPYPTIAMERNGYPNNQEITALNNKQLNLPKINCPTVRSRNKWDDFNKDWYADTYISPDYSLQTVNNISASQQYLKQKDSTEHMQVGFTAGVRLVKPLNNHLQLTTGLQYSQINQKYVYRSENEIKLTTVVTVRTIIRAPGDTVVVRDTSIVQNIGFKNKVEKNRHRSIDIPILLGYQFGRGSVKVGINAGVILNVSSWYEGVILDSSLAVVPVQKGSQIYKSKLGMGLYAGINVTKELSNDMQLFVEPYYKHSIDNITSGSMPYQQKFGTAGVLMGVRWSLNRK
jgi:Outer membrane protein beta-barrel domain